MINTTREHLSVVRVAEEDDEHTFRIRADEDGFNDQGTDRARLINPQVWQDAGFGLQVTMSSLFSLIITTPGESFQTGFLG